MGQDKQDPRKREVIGQGEKRRMEEEEGGGQALICKLSVSNYL